MIQLSRMARESIPTTGRTPAFLARRYGYPNVAELIRLIPYGAKVVDIGAGTSLLGHAVTLARPDITWWNVDLCYKDADVVSRLTVQAPPNLRFSPGDIVAFSPDLKKLTGKVDCVFSYWLLPHLSVNSLAPAEQAAGHMWELLADGGRIIAGPAYPHGFASMRRRSRAVRFTKALSRRHVARELAQATRAAWLPRMVLWAGNNFGIHLGKHMIRFFSWWQSRRVRRLSAWVSK